MKKSNIIFGIGMLISYISYAQRCFGPEVCFTAGSTPHSISSFDFNGDGNMDLATANYNSHNVSILLGNGFGFFSTATSYPTGTASGPFSITNADFNGDGNTDLATANYTSNDVSVLLGDGLGGFSGATHFAVASGRAYSIVSTDFNGDGNIDLATCNGFGGNVSILLGNGAGSFSAPTNFNLYTISCYPYSLINADFNGDGNMDLATANNSSANVSILLGTGLGGFSAATSFAVGSLPYSISTADFNEDGIMDLVTANYGSNNVSVLLGNGSGGFLAATTFPAGASPQSVTASDLNEDGNVDLAVAITNNVAVLLGDGSGGFAAASSFVAGANPYFITSTDINGDGKMDLATANFSSSVCRFINAGFTLSLTATNSTCNNGIGGNGTIVASFSGGMSGPSFVWNTTPVQTGDSAFGLTPGTYTVTVTDNNTCSQKASATITGPPPIIASSVTQNNVLCFGGSNGSATASVTGGIPPYTYSWNTTPIQNTAIATNLSAGDYSCTITDSIGCIAFPPPSFSISEPSLLELYPEISVVNPNTKCSGICDGSAHFSVYGGTAPYFFQWNSSANNQTTQVATQLCQGNYSVIVTDTNGCSATDSISVGLVTAVDPNIFLTNLAAVDQLSVSSSFSAYYTYNLPPTINANTSNPRNFVDPGKKARFKVECTNQKINGQSIVSGICKVRSNNPYITITDSSSALNNIGWNGNAWSADEFEIDIAANTPPGTNAYIDFVVQESGQNYATTCIAIPITPLVYSPTTPLTIDDDSNPDSQGNDNDVCEPGETIEFYPWLNNISTLDAEYVRGRFENLDNHSFINIWNGVPGVGTTVYDATWWNYGFAMPQTINASATNTTPEYDFVFDFDSSSISTTDFKLYMVMAGGFKLFSGTALSLVQWTLPYTFNNTTTTSIDANNKNNEVLSLYPNPANDKVKFAIKNKNIEKIAIYNQVGALIYQSEGVTNELDVKGFSKGVYLISVYSGNKIINKKLVIR